MQEESSRRGQEPEQIGKILERVGSGQSSRDQKSQMVETRTEDCTCEECGSTFQGEVTTYKRFTPPPFKRPTPPREIRPRECPKCNAERQEREEKEMEQLLEGQRKGVRESWRRVCGMPAELLARTFENFEQKYQKAAFRVAESWAKDFNLDSPRGFPSLIFYSAIPGVGKGHLMAAIVNYVLDNWQGNPERGRLPIRFESGPSLVRRIRATYNLRRQDEVHEREDEVYQSLAGVPLLLLDDVGKESPSNFTRETYWYIIDERVKTGLPVIISSRLEFEGERSLQTLMGIDTVSRLYGMTRGEFIEMEGQDYRRLKAIP